MNKIANHGFLARRESKISSAVNWQTAFWQEMEMGAHLYY